MPKYDAVELNEQITALKPQLTDMVTNLSGMQGNVMNVVNNGNFQGAYATSVKAYFTEVQAKAITTLTTLIDGINLATDKLKENGTTLDASSGSKIDSEYITGEQTQEMTTFGEAFDTHKQTIDTTIAGVSDLGSFTKPTAAVGEKVEEAKRSLKDIDQKVMTFSDTDASGDIEALLSDFNALVSYMGACSGSGSISYTSGDLEKQKFYAGLEKLRNKVINQVEARANEQLRVDMEGMPDSNQQSDYDDWIQEMVGKYGQKFLDKLKGPFWVAKITAKGAEKGLQFLGEKMLAQADELLVNGLSSLRTNSAPSRTTRKALEKALDYGENGSKMLGIGSKLGKSMPVIGFVASTGSHVLEGDSFEKAATKAMVSTAVTIAGGQSGMVIGAAVGTLIPIPGLGTAAGAIIGFGIGWGASVVTDAIINRYWDDPVGQASKDLQAVGDVIGNVANNIGNAIASVIPPMPDFGW